VSARTFSSPVSFLKSPMLAKQSTILCCDMRRDMQVLIIIVGRWVREKLDKMD
jgi:hypothetical protein